MDDGDPAPRTGTTLDVVTDPTAFAQVVDPLIRRDPIRCNLLATVLAVALAHGPTPGSLWMTVRGHGEGGSPENVILAAMITPPFGLWLTPVDGARADDPEDPRNRVAADVLAARLLDRPDGPGAALPSVGGVPGSAGAFARAWHELTGRRARVSMQQRMYALTELIAPDSVPGAARPAGPGDRELCLDWMEAFRLEAVPDQPRAGDRVVDERIADGRLTLWCDGDGQPVSLAGTTPVVAGVARVGPVYTPPERRGHGYGAAVTAAATRLGFALGAQRCMLFTDLANPTSNALYPRLGYRPIGDAVTYAFTS